MKVNSITVAINVFGHAGVQESGS